MSKMIVGINYNDDGTRYIARISYVVEMTEKGLKGMAYELNEYHDEVYIIDFNPNHTDFINEIVTKGCRI